MLEPTKVVENVEDMEPETLAEFSNGLGDDEDDGE